MCKEDVKLTRSEMREQAFMLLFSKSFDDEPLEATIDDNAEMFKGGVCAYAQAAVSGIEDKRDEIDGIISSKLKAYSCECILAVACNFTPCGF